MAKKPNAKPVQVKQVEGAEVATEVLASAIVEISAGMKKLRAGSLNEHALVLLIHSACGRRIPQHDISKVLDGIESLERQFVRKRAK